MLTRERRAAILLAAASMATACAPMGSDAQSVDENGNAAIIQESEIAVATYKVREADPARPQPTFDTATASGTVTALHGCLALRTGEATYLLVFPEGSISRSGDMLLVDGRGLAEGRKISVTGSRTGGPAVGTLDLPPGCTELERFVVAPGGLTLE